MAAGSTSDCREKRQSCVSRSSKIRSENAILVLRLLDTNDIIVLSIIVLSDRQVVELFHLQFVRLLCSGPDKNRFGELLGTLLDK